MNTLKRLEKQRRKIIVKKVVTVSVSVLVSFVLIALILVPFFKKQESDIHIYDEAMSYIADDEFAEAYEKLRSIEGSGYKDTTSLMYLCSSHMLYNSGDVIGAYKELKKVNFSNQTDEKMAKIKEYKDMLKREYNLYMEEQALADSQEADNEDNFGVNEEYIDVTGDDVVNPIEDAFLYEETENEL